MIAQLVLKTLVACQPKVPIVNSSTTPVDPPSVDDTTQVTPMVEKIGVEQSTEWPSSIPDPIGLDALPPLKPSSDPLGFYASEVQLSELAYLAQFQDLQTDQSKLCAELCERHPDLMSDGGESLRLHLTNIDNCRIDLIQNWKEVVDAAPQDPSSVGKEIQTFWSLPEISIGVVECNGDTVQVIKGRAATVPIQAEETVADWGGYFVRLAQEEATAIFAFEELLDHLQDWNAPTKLLDWCSQIVTEEQTHTLMMAGLARRNGHSTAGIQFPSRNRVSMAEMALHNALAGCIAETWSAVLIQYQSMNTPKYKRVFQRIAKDEISHAEFSWTLHRWFMTNLSPAEQQQIQAAMSKALLTQPEYTHVVELGEMGVDTYQLAWAEFSRELALL